MFIAVPWISEVCGLKLYFLIDRATQRRVQKMRCVASLRGIKSGRKNVKMADLKKASQTLISFQRPRHFREECVKAAFEDRNKDPYQISS
jgi:hypothetical protein